ncbi:MAG: hypothetical protein R6V39_00540 [Desulfovibrionales bacterium]
MQAETKTRDQEVSPAGMAWISGRQKPFYSPRIIKKGKNKGRIEVKYLRSHSVYKTKIINRSAITRLFPPFDSYLVDQKAVFQGA